ncbi:uncharacterized protein N7529_002662 [Penicillium soppii]|uniref:uncharacterized protein n=1 Tax=Penicillium soppii TaxID=69789 RepID=UPI002547B53B|nr:uncharacterized protein N7529_002662 [Penicillium soppii]KAJ5874232.1 hypothetical protein N7529_002662 [Penicillium soppii]
MQSWKIRMFALFIKDWASVGPQPGPHDGPWAQKSSKPIVGIGPKAQPNPRMDWALGFVGFAQAYSGER